MKQRPAKLGAGSTEVKLIIRRLGSALGTLLVIAYLTSWGLILAERGREHLPARPLEAAWQALARTAQYVFFHPQEYFWRREIHNAFTLVSETLQSSAGLLLLALGVAFLLGLPLGLAAALTQRKSSSALIMLISVLGTSTPSFLFAMFLWVVNIWMHRTFAIKVLPSAGFGWDAHLIMPTLVLAMRPLAQLAQVTYVAMRDILQQDYIRTARAKGLSWRMVRNAHIVPNLLIPTLTTLGASLRFSLASLPVVELFFAWPGVGLTLLEAIAQDNAFFIIDLILSLGVFFLVVNLAIEILFPLIDARLRTDSTEGQLEERRTFHGWLRGLLDIFVSWLGDLRQRFTRQTRDLPPLPEGLSLPPADKERPTASRRKWVLDSIFSNPALLLGGLLLAALISVVLFGEQLTEASPYQLHGVMMIDGVIGSAPYAPSAMFPWGTDYIGRDMQALVLAGGKRTLALAFFAMLARLLIGAVLGALAGWQRNGWLDRMVTGAIGVWAAFPVTLFAMLLIQALGIQQGMWVFVVALSVVGWGEVAQFVRAQVLSLKPQPFVESARSVGARSDQILARHILPNLVNALIVLAVLEMGGVMMLLAELGFLNIYMGGGFRAAIGDMGRSAVVAHFSDVPEWAALIANIRNWWRSYPWMALYPGVAFFLSIITFNLFGEGLRRFLDDTHANLSRLFNRYTLVVGVALVIVMALLLQSVSPLGVYRSEALRFDEQRVLQDIQALSSPEFSGRETGTPGAEAAAHYIAGRMKSIGLFPGGKGNNYIEAQPNPRPHLVEIPRLQLLDEQGIALEAFVYREDFVEIPASLQHGSSQGKVVALAFGPPLEKADADVYGLQNMITREHILLIHKEDLGKVSQGQTAGLLVISDDPADMQVKKLFPYEIAYYNIRATPVMYVTPQTAGRLLAPSGHSLEQVRQVSDSLQAGEAVSFETETQVSMSVVAVQPEDLTSENYYAVMGVIPGADAESGLDSQVIIVSAYYDGLGIGPEGVFYPGANDNASGVAMMLELARLLKQSSYKPDKTIVFVAWPGGERGDGLSVTALMNLRTGFNKLGVEAVIELSGVGAGQGRGAALGEDSSYRLVKLFQEAAGKMGVQVTTRGRGPHYGADIPPVFGGRKAMTLSVSWDGSDELAHTTQDTLERIDPRKVKSLGRTVYLTLLVLSRETEY